MLLKETKNSSKRAMYFEVHAHNSLSDEPFYKFEFEEDSLLMELRMARASYLVHSRDLIPPFAFAELHVINLIGETWLNRDSLYDLDNETQYDLLKTIHERISAEKEGVEFDEICTLLGLEKFTIDSIIDTLAAMDY